MDVLIQWLILLEGSFPTISPSPHEAKVPSDKTHAPLSSHQQRPAEKAPDSPSPVPAVSSHQHTPRKRTRNPSSALTPLLPPDTYHPG